MNKNKISQKHKPKLPKETLKELKKLCKYYIKGIKVKATWEGFDIKCELIWNTDKFFDIIMDTISFSKPLTVKDIVFKNILFNSFEEKIENVIFYTDEEIEVFEQIPEVKKLQQELTDYCNRIDWLEKKFDFNWQNEVLSTIK